MTKDKRREIEFSAIGEENEPEETESPEPAEPQVYRALENFSVQLDSFLSFRVGDPIEPCLVSRLLEAKVPIGLGQPAFVKCESCGHHNAIL